MVVIHRSQAKVAEYNPRTMTADARRKLGKGIDKVGLLAPIIWNKRTGNVVGGHQRLAKMDKEAGSLDYTLTVAAVDLGPKEEMEANLLLNNAAAQGEFQIDKLEKMLGEGLDLAGTGWDEADVYRMFGDVTPTPEGAAGAAEAKAQVEKALDRIMSMERSTNDAKAMALERDREDFYLVVVFKNYDARVAFTNARGLEDNRYQSGESFGAVDDGEG